MLQCLQYICENESIEYTKTIEQKIKQKIQIQQILPIMLFFYGYKKK